MKMILVLFVLRLTLELLIRLQRHCFPVQLHLNFTDALMQKPQHPSLPLVVLVKLIKVVVVDPALTSYKTQPLQPEKSRTGAPRTAETLVTCSPRPVRPEHG